ITPVIWISNEARAFSSAGLSGPIFRGPAGCVHPRRARKSNNTAAAALRTTPPGKVKNARGPLITPFPYAGRLRVYGTAVFPPSQSGAERNCGASSTEPRVDVATSATKRYRFLGTRRLPCAGTPSSPVQAGREKSLSIVSELLSHHDCEDTH